MSGAASGPRITIAKPARANANGVLPVPGSTTLKGQRAQPDSGTSKLSSTRLKLVVRRLPPGLSQSEFEQALGDEWKVGGRKVDWATFKPGKISKDSAKPSKPSRAYVHVKNSEDIGSLSQKVQSVTFHDAKNSSNDPSLLGPPLVEFAPYGRIPSGKTRKDARQGTIDQDTEFIDFLESLTNPITKAPTVDQEATLKGKEKVTTTPLVDFLKEKKASKGKEGSGKGAKHARQDSKDSRGSSSSSSKKSPALSNAVPSKKRSSQPSKVEQAAKEVVSKLNEQASAAKAASSPAPSSSKAKSIATKAVPSGTGNAALAEKKRERGNAATAVKMLQRDLLGGSGGRGGREGARNPNARAGNTQANTPQGTANVQDSKSNGVTQTSNSKKTETGSPPEVSNATAAPKVIATPTGPSASSSPPSVRSNAPTSSPITTSKHAAASTATQAFLKHANPSQGVTEPLLEEYFAKFGLTKNVEIDKKKGFAYIDFENAESLQKAIKASPIKIAQAQVVVLERKTGPNLQARNPRGGGLGGGNRGGSTLNTRGSNTRGRGNSGRGGANNAHVHKAKAVPPAAGPPEQQTVTPAVTNALPTLPPSNTPDAT